MEAYIPSRPALGQVATLGSFYDARTDTFIPLSLFKTTPPADAVTTTKNPSTNSKYSVAETYKDKLEFLDVKAELGASVLAGLVSVGGSGRYLSDTRSSNLVAQASIHFSITTVDEKLNLMANGVEGSLAFRTIDTDVATHVVIGITWGAHCVVSAKRQCAASADRSQISGELQASLGILKMLGVRATANGGLDKEAVDVTGDRSFEVTVHGDVLANDGLTPTDFDGAQAFIRNLPKYVECSNDGKGKPISYALLPLHILSVFNLLEIKADIVIHQLSIDCLEKFVKLFDDFRLAQQTLNDYHARIIGHSATVPYSHLRDVEDMLGQMRGWEAATKSEYAATLKDVRSGRADAQVLWGFLNRCQNGGMSIAGVQSLMRYVDKMDFVDLITREGARYVGYNGPALSTLLLENRHDDAYIVYFNDDLRMGSDVWNDISALLLELLRDHSRRKLAVVVDCDATGDHLDKIRISQLRNGRVIVEDVIEQRRILATNCVMRFDETTMERNIGSKPLQRRAVKICCPHKYCDRTLQPTWICSSCHTIVEYGYVDNLLYCDCASCPFDSWEFKCRDPRHGSAWIKFEREAFKKYLDALEPFEELNILILGETGVGKSTWINAFINYLTFDQLDEAIAAEDLKWVIPCSFQTQIVEGGRFVQRSVRVGSHRSDEADGSGGQSATQQTSVYAVDIGSTRVRLIDTPGIGDTRGVEQDNKNMADILRVLRSYNNLHGILILLKPNAPRLTVMFRFCIKQLLAHLHRNAVENIVFGFTNTRGSNYKPGDTFKPLEKLLSEYDAVRMGLFEHNVYCFDSESFRYLAAQKKGTDMGLWEDNRRSWEYSVTECKRLVTHFKGLKPHEVRGTINLNETRNIIIRLTEPMALLAQKMTASIAVNEEQIKELEQAGLTRAELESRLFVQKESLESVEVDQPRTVCTNAACVEFRSGGEERDEMAIIYKTMCHRPCYRGSVKPRTKGDPQLQFCAAMNGDGVCECGHIWMDHMHIYYEYQPKTYRHRDEAVARDLADNATMMQLKQEAIRMKAEAIKGFQLEHNRVQTTAIQFGFFLKRHAITPYNDGTLEYIDMLIDQEKMKLQKGGKKNRDALDALEKYRAEHLEKVRVLKKAMERGDESELLDDDGIRQAIDSLFGLPHFGEDLRAIFQNNERAAEMTYREKSFNVSAGSHWSRPKTLKQVRPDPGPARSRGGSGSGSGDTGEAGSFWLTRWWRGTPNKPPKSSTAQDRGKRRQ